MFGLVFPCLNIACLYVLVESVGFGWLAWMLGLGLSKRCSSRLSWVQIWNTDNNPWNAFWQPLNKHHTESAWKWRKTFYSDWTEMRWNQKDMIRRDSRSKQGINLKAGPDSFASLCPRWKMAWRKPMTRLLYLMLKSWSLAWRNKHCLNYPI